MEHGELMNARLDGVVRPHKGAVKIDATGTGKNDPNYVLNIKIDWTGWTVQQVLDVAARSLWISRQRVLRGFSVEQVNNENGKTILATDMGKKPTQVIDVEKTYMAMFANASPEKQKEMLEELQAKANKE